MTLESLRYGSFKPLAVAPEARALPGYGGQVEEWANYQFQVKALELKESTMTDGERKKLGPLALRLVERLQGPALQIAKALGLEKLGGADGTKVLLKALEDDLLPMRRQVAVEMYQAGSNAGMLSRQHGESMASYVLRRETWWTQLQELDPEVQCSKAILGEQLLTQSGLSHMEQQLIRTAMNNDLSDMRRLGQTLRDQFGTVHEREKQRKGKGDHRGKSWWNRGYTSYLAENPEEIVDVETQNENYGPTENYDEEIYDEDAEYQEIEGEEEFEQEIVAWFVEQGIHPQTCGADDLEMLYDTVEAEAVAFYSRQMASNRGYSVPVINNYQPSGTSTLQEKQARVLAAKQRTRCRACGQQGHWQRDWICPKRKSKGSFKGKGVHKGGKGGKDKSKSGKGKSSPDSPKSGSGSGSPATSKPRVVYFSIKNVDKDSESFAGMALRKEPLDPEPLEEAQQRHLEQEVMRLMSLPQQELDRRFNQEIGYMEPTPKTSMPTPPAGLHPAEDVRRAVPHQASLTSTPARTAIESHVDECLHTETTRRGSNAYVNMESCKQCGKVLYKERRDETRSDQTMHRRDPHNCEHMEVSWKGTNGYAWKWTCQDCGMSDQVKRQPGVPRPIPGRANPTTPMRGTSSSTTHQAFESPVTRMQDNVMFEDPETWEQCLGLLDRMVRSHLAIHGSIRGSEMMQLLNAVTLCVRNFDPRTSEVLIASPGSRIPPLPSRTSEASDLDDDLRLITFGKHKDKTYAQTYEEDPGYVDWTLKEADKGEGYCAGMKKWMQYCIRRRGLESRRPSMTSQGSRQAFMALEEDNTVMWVDEEENDHEECTYLFLDSGCNQTCHGEKWMQKFIQHTGYELSWINQDVHSLNGIGGGSKTIGERELYITLENELGQHIPGEISSTEILGSTAPLLLSLPAQERLGLVVDFSKSEIYSKLLKMTFKAVRGRRNRLLGLKMHPGHSMDDKEMIPVEPIALMADDEEDTPPWKTPRRVGSIPKIRPGHRSTASGSASSTADWIELAPGHTMEVKPVPKRREESQEEEEILVEVDPSPEGQDDDDIHRHEQAGQDDWLEDHEEELHFEEDLEEPEEESRARSGEEPDGEAPPQTEEDFWTWSGTGVIRHHLTPRKKLFYPENSRMDLPVDLGRFEPYRKTFKMYEDGSLAEVEDTWTGKETDVLTKTHRGVDRHQRGPTGVHMIRRKTFNLDTDELISEDGEKELLDPLILDRPLPEGVHNIKAEYHYVDEIEDNSVARQHRLQAETHWWGAEAAALRDQSGEGPEEVFHQRSEEELGEGDWEHEGPRHGNVVHLDSSSSTSTTTLEVRSGALLRMCTSDPDVSS